MDTETCLDLSLQRFMYKEVIILFFLSKNVYLRYISMRMSPYDKHFCDTDYKTLIIYNLTLFKQFSSVIPVVDFLLSLYFLIKTIVDC